MKGVDRHTWARVNQDFMHEAIARMRDYLASSAGVRSELNLDAKASGSRETAFARLRRAFGLSSFESSILLLCAGVSIDNTLFDSLVFQTAKPSNEYPTFGLAMSAFAGAHWSALTPRSPLRRWRLIWLGAGHSLTACPLNIDEWVLHYLTGLEYQEEAILDARPLTGPPLLTTGQRRAAERLAADLAVDQAPALVVNIQGADSVAQAAVAAQACSDAGARAYLLCNSEIWQNRGLRKEFVLAWDRYAALSGGYLVVDRSAEGSTEGLSRLLDSLVSPVVVLGDAEHGLGNRPRRNHRLEPLSAEDRRELWSRGLGDLAPKLEERLADLASDRSLDTGFIRATCVEVQHLSGNTGKDNALLEHVRLRCRVETKNRLGRLATPIDASATFEDLVLPERSLSILREIVSHVRGRNQVYEAWGFGSKYRRGLGISALFAGVSGTGKTMAGEVLAHELGLDLYRIDLSTVVSKYIGETEKNISRIFDAAEGSRVILLFDEADALFGKRSEVRDSHDRYANIEISYLLQRMEAYQGLAILTTNMRDALDTAFVRRIRFIVNFPFPDTPSREQIWRRVFPDATPTHGLSIAKLARLRVTGGGIRNIAMNGAFNAARTGEPVGMKHLLQAAELEYGKLDKPLGRGDTRDWLIEEVSDAAS